MSFSFLIVLPKLMRSGVAPAAIASSISVSEAVSNAGAEPREQIENLRRRVRLDGVEDARVGQRAREAEIVLAHDVEIDDEPRAILAIAGEELLDAVSHERHPPSARKASPRLANEGFAGDATFSPARWRRDAKSLTRRRDRPPTPATT